MIEEKELKESMLELQRKFEKIRNTGYVKAVSKGYGSIGETFERLIGKEKSDFAIPDYKGIEIKTTRAYSKSNINLFCAVPDGEDLFEIDRIRETYGYPDKTIREAKVVFCIVYGNIPCPIGAKYYFKLDVDWKEEKVYLAIYNKNFKLIERKVYWSFKLLEEKLYTKMKVLMLVEAWTNTINNETYYKYYKMNYYLLKDFNTFIKLIEEGYISLTFRISVHKEKAHYGLPHNHGLSFGIKKENLSKLYDLI